MSTTAKAERPSGPWKGVRLEDKITFFSELNDALRRVYLDGRKPTAVILDDPTYAGYSTGYWDGDTLVIDTVALRDNTYIEGFTPHSDQMTIRERIRFVEPGLLEDRISVSDPKALVRPWIRSRGTGRRPIPMINCEFACAEGLEHASEIATATIFAAPRNPARLLRGRAVRATGLRRPTPASSLDPASGVDRIPTVASVMTPFPYWVGVGESLRRARALMVEHQVRHLPVLEDETLVGVLSDRDLKRALDPDMGLPPEDELFVRDIYAGEPYAVDSCTPLDLVLEHMAAHHIGSALVTKHGRLVGIFTMTDACRVYCEHLRRLFPSRDGDEVA